MKDLNKHFVSFNNTMHDVLKVIQQGHIGIALVVDDEQRLVGTITDGDIRRAMLNKLPLDVKVAKLLGLRSQSHLKPTVVSVGTSHEKILELMTKKVIRQIPIVDDQGRVVELALLSELVEEEMHLPLTAMVMAGGRGERLFPLTKDVPKPMLPLASRPLIERTIEQFKKCGITKISIATHYKSDVIAEHFGNGNSFGVDIDYINEDQPLGTAGALGMTEVPDGPTLVINGDVLTGLNFQTMYDFHRANKAVMTVGVRKCDLEVPYGVVEIDDVAIKNIIEKPVQSFIVNAGVYLVEPAAYKFIPKGRRFDMTDLVARLLKEKLLVISFPIEEYWLDIGHPADYQRAKEDVKNGRV